MFAQLEKNNYLQLEHFRMLRRKLKIVHFQRQKFFQIPRGSMLPDLSRYLRHRRSFVH